MTSRPCLIYERGGRTLGSAVLHLRIKQNSVVRLRVALQLCRALKFLHELGVLNLDLKGNNVLYSVSTDRIRIIDFGLSQLIAGNENPYFAVSRNKPCCYLRAAYEYSTQRKFTTKTDIYSLLF